MPRIQISPGHEMNYAIDDFTDPWRRPETVLLLHGNFESGDVWFGWAPHLARNFRVVRPDMRGFGGSTPMPRDYRWTLDGIVGDYVRLMDALGIGNCHLVGAKIGGHIARRFASRHPERVRTLTLVGTPPPRLDHLVEGLADRIKEYDMQGVGAWARRTMPGRLGSRFAAEGAEWWSQMMSRTPVSTQIGFMSSIPASDVTADLPRIACPTLVITNEDSLSETVEDTREWQRQIADSSLLVLPGDSHHVAATDADNCARATRDFILRVSPTTS